MNLFDKLQKNPSIKKFFENKDFDCSDSNSESSCECEDQNLGITGATGSTGATGLTGNNVLFPEFQILSGIVDTITVTPDQGTLYYLEGVTGTSGPTRVFLGSGATIVGTTIKFVLLNGSDDSGPVPITVNFFYKPTNTSANYTSPGTVSFYWTGIVRPGNSGWLNLGFSELEF
jgi:hypothetical protein